MRIVRYCLWVTVLLPSVAPGQEKLPAGPVGSPDGQGYAEHVKPFLVKHCAECHSGEKPKGDFRLDSLETAVAGHSGEDRWRTVLEQLRTGTMPPKKKPRPAEGDLRAATDWIERKVGSVEAARRAQQGRTVLRRLNRLEYTNTLRDLLGVDLDLRETLALDSSSDGFDNVGAALHLSSFAMERYFEAADKALNAAIASRPAPPVFKKRMSLKDGHNVRNKQERVFRVIDDTVVCFTSVHWQRLYLQVAPQHLGLYRFRISASGFQSGGKPVTFEVSSHSTGLVGYFDAPADTPTEFEFTVRGEPNGQSPISLLPYGLGDSKPVQTVGPEEYKGPGLAIQWIEMEGPLYDSWPPPSHRRIFGDLAQEKVKGHNDRLEVVSTAPAQDAERILRNFARRALRRTPTQEDLKPYLAIVQARLAEKDSFEQAVRVGLTAILMSRDFLFLDEKPGVLDDFALASRLSYFLWSTMPDDELLALAEEKKLGKPETLRRQVERMLASPKAATFTTNFLGQWLGLRDIDFTSPNYLAYPEFDQMLKVSMVRETELFFEELLKKDLSLENLVRSDFSILNGRLAQHYGIPGVDGLWEFRRTPLPPGSHRGGLLTMASVLKVTADGTSTSPVKRGAWVLERILGTPPPKPPPNVGALEPDIRGATTIREQLAKHRQIETCATCHSRIDPPGFALESFDVIGGWREFYRLTNWVKGAKEIKGKHYLQGPNVDPTGEMADGQKFRNIDEFKELLLAEKEQVARNLATKILTYATGGAPDAADRSEIDAIVSRVREKNYGLRSLLHDVVESKLFREK
jgi:hypothetical protein